MIDEVSVLIVDDNIEFGDLLKEYLGAEEDIRIVGIAGDGLQALDMIKALTPDIVILDVIMPNLDGIGVLEKISTMKLNRKPIFIMLSAIGQDVFIRRAITLGAEYYIVKPFDINVLISRVRQLHTESRSETDQKNRYFSTASYEDGRQVSQERDLEATVTKLMHSMGIPPHMAGYQYIREAVLFSLRSTKIFNSVTKVIYPAVAAKFNTTPQKVERAIRNAIDSAWSRTPASGEAIHMLITATNRKNKPTNSEFLAIMTDRIRLTTGNKQPAEKS